MQGGLPDAIDTLPNQRVPQKILKKVSPYTSVCINIQDGEYEDEAEPWEGDPQVSWLGNDLLSGSQGETFVK